MCRGVDRDAGFRVRRHGFQGGCVDHVHASFGGTGRSSAVLSQPLFHRSAGHRRRALVGHFWPELGKSLKPLGDAFIKLVKMIIAPVIFLTIATGIAGMRDLSQVGRVAAKAFGYFLVFSTLALIIGLVIANVVQPGRGLNIDPASLDAGAVAKYSEAAHETTVVGFLTGIIPTTLVSAFVEGNILQTLLVAILFGLSLALVGEAAAPVTRALESLSQVIFKLVAILMKA
ncbi:cation:dicarboxylate symporter family transporter, partial [Caulobacter sp. B11]|uniref:cation:dicarboxylate symporter family transporter n=1 Tax=Caulobacter sp. B11 TaxID=2048899 RepID=UPI0035195791